VEAIHGDYGVNIKLEELRDAEIWAFVNHVEKWQKLERWQKFRYASKGTSWAIRDYHATKTVMAAVSLPAAVEFALILMSRKRRSDVMNGMLDWYPQWVSNKGRFWADVLCWWRIGAALFGGLLDFAGRVAEVVGKFRGAK